MTYQELQQAYNYWQGQYNMACQNPQLSQVTVQAYNEMQKIAAEIQKFQSQVGYGNQFQQQMYQQPYQQQPVGYYPAQNMQPVGYYPPQQQNFSAGVNFGRQGIPQPVPSMQAPSATDRHSEGRYQKLVNEKYGNAQRPFQPMVQQPNQLRPVQQETTIKPSKFIQGHKWSYLCGNSVICKEEIQGDYVSYKTETTGGIKSFDIDDMTDENQEAICIEKAVNKYAYLTNTQAAFVDLKFSKTYTTYDLKEIFEAVSSGEVGEGGAKQTISDIMSKKKTNEETLQLIKKLYHIGQYIDSRYSRVFNLVSNSAYELKLRVSDILTDYEEILNAARAKYDERKYANLTHLTKYINELFTEKDKFTTSFVEGEKEKDTYLKVKWDYTIKGMYVDYSLFAEIERLMKENTIDKGKSLFYKITSLSYQSLYDILNKSDMGNELILYMFTRNEDGNFVAYEIIKGDIGTFYIHNNKISL